MISRKKKWCKAGHMDYLFGGGYCKNHQHLRRKIEVNGTDLLDNLFREIWDSRNRVCEESGDHLYIYNKWSFHHVLPKKDFPEFELRPENIMILSLMSHSKWETYAWSDRQKMNIWPKAKRIAEELLNELEANDKRRITYSEKFQLHESTSTTSI